MRVDLIKRGKDISLIPLTKFVNKWIENDVFLHCSYIARVVPIDKDGDRDNRKIYTPIHISIFFEKHNLFYNKPFGFRKGLNTSEAVSFVCSNIIEGIEDGRYLNVTLCDLQRAFDCLQAFTFLHSYLEYTQQFTAITGNFGAIMDIRHGISHGSCS
ncbi:uncharacterized protein [Euwallacea similis]|uniref:uncharacterized protein n=1 Tax=Euwallacea similis TaxID=1736056 RepID=UPI003450BAE6